MIYDLIIIGMGPAGMSAAIYAKRNGLNVLLLEKNIPGGLTNYTSEIDNYLGLPNTKGPELANKFLEHIKFLEIPYQLKEVTSIIDEGETKKIITKDNEFICKKIIVATGRSPKLLGLPNEIELTGKGVSRCALCDGMFFKDKIVAVIGGGNSALQESLHLAKLCSKVYLIHRRDEFRAEINVQDRIKEKENIEIIYNAEVIKINAENERLKSITLNNNQELEISGLFIYIGYNPNTHLLKDIVDIDENGYVKVDEKFETSVKGIYAIGDIILKDYYQLILAASDGAKAAINISNEVLK